MRGQPRWVLLSVLLAPACGSYRPSEPSCLPANAGVADGIPCGLPWNGPTGSCRKSAAMLCYSDWLNYVVKNEHDFDALFDCSYPAGDGDAGTLLDGGAAVSPPSGIDFVTQTLVIACRVDDAIAWALNHEGVVTVGVRNPVRCGGAGGIRASMTLVPKTDHGLTLFECPQAQCVCDNPIACSSAP
jgi:hypothetical protein